MAGTKRAAWQVGLGWLMVVVGIGAFFFGLWNQVDIGSCGEVIPCPPESNVYIPAIVVGALVAIGGGNVAGVVAAGWLPLVLGSPVFLVVKALVDRPADARSGLFVAAGVIVGVIVLLVVGLGMLGASETRRQKFKETGRQARATVTEIFDTGGSVNDRPRVHIHLRLEPLDGSAPFEVVDKTVLDRVAPQAVGDVACAWYAAEDRDHWAVEYAPPEGFSDDVVEQFGLPVRVDVDDLDRLSALERLAALHASGALDEVEYEREKGRLLGT